MPIRNRVLGGKPHLGSNTEANHEGEMQRRSNHRHAACDEGTPLFQSPSGAPNGLCDTPELVKALLEVLPAMSLTPQRPHPAR